jgi:circadian clock protein KaiB
MEQQPDATGAETADGAAPPTDAVLYVLRLYVTGMTPRSSQAISTIKALCDEHLAGRCDLEVIDIYQQPELARDEEIVATPTLVKKLPLPLRRFIGNLSDTERILFRLNLRGKD